MVIPSLLLDDFGGGTFGWYLTSGRNYYYSGVCGLTERTISGLFFSQRRGEIYSQDWPMCQFGPPFSAPNKQQHRPFPAAGLVSFITLVLFSCTFSFIGFYNPERNNNVDETSFPTRQKWGADIFNRADPGLRNLVIFYLFFQSASSVSCDAWAKSNNWILFTCFFPVVFSEINWSNQLSLLLLFSTELNHRSCVAFTTQQCIHKTLLFK